MFSVLVRKLGSLIVLSFLCSLGHTQTTTSTGYYSWFALFKPSVFAPSSFTDDKDDLTSLSIHPSLIKKTQTNQVIMFGEQGLTGDLFITGCYVLKTKKANLAVAVNNFNTGDIRAKWEDANGYQEKSISGEQSWVYTLTAAPTFLKTPFSPGVNLKFATRNIANVVNLTAILADIGATFAPNKNLSLIATVRNIGSGDQVPSFLTVTASFKRPHNPNLGITVVGSFDQGLSVNKQIITAGAEVNTKTISTWLIYRSQEEPLATWGVKLNLKKFVFSYSYGMPKRMPNPIHTVNLGVKL